MYRLLLVHELGSDSYIETPCPGYSNVCFSGLARCTDARRGDFNFSRGNGSSAGTPMDVVNKKRGLDFKAPEVAFFTAAVSGTHALHHGDDIRDSRSVVVKPCHKRAGRTLSHAVGSRVWDAENVVIVREWQSRAGMQDNSVQDANDDTSELPHV